MNLSFTGPIQSSHLQNPSTTTTTTAARPSSSSSCCCSLGSAIQASATSSHRTSHHRTTGCKMFSLSLIEHTLALPPALLGLSREKAVRHQLEKLYLDKVIANVGLCISVYDIKSIDGGYIFPSEGSPTYTVKFRLIMFRPFVGEVIDAKLKSFDENGLHLSLGFFDDIHIPSHLMLQPSKFLPDPENGNRCRWVWEYTADEGDPPQILAVDEIGERIKFRVESINYPAIPLEPPKDSKSFAPMVITGSMYVEGLGPNSWWY